MEGVSELLDGGAQGEGQHVINGGEHLRFTGLYGLFLLLLQHHVAQFKSILTQFGRHEACHARGVIGRIGLGHHLHGHKTILL